MTHLARRGPTMVALVLGMGCQQSARPPQRLVQEAAELVDRFVAADTSGQVDSAYALIYKTNCDVLPSADYIAPTASARRVGEEMHGDTVAIIVEYNVVGEASAGDSRAMGGQNWRFVPGAKTERSRFNIVHDSAGHPWIDCDYHPPIHLSVSLMGPYVERLDSASRAGWESAVGGRGR